MTEWFKVLVLKINVYITIPWVQIPLYPINSFFLQGL